MMLPVTNVIEMINGGLLTNTISACFWSRATDEGLLSETIV